MNISAGRILEGMLGLPPEPPDGTPRTSVESAVESGSFLPLLMNLVSPPATTGYITGVHEEIVDDPIPHTQRTSGNALFPDVSGSSARLSGFIAESTGMAIWPMGEGEAADEGDSLISKRGDIIGSEDDSKVPYQKETRESRWLSETGLNRINTLKIQSEQVRTTRPDADLETGRNPSGERSMAGQEMSEPSVVGSKGFRLQSLQSPRVDRADTALDAKALPTADLSKNPISKEDSFTVSQQISKPTSSEPKEIRLQSSQSPHVEGERIPSELREFFTANIESVSKADGRVEHSQRSTTAVNKTENGKESLPVSGRNSSGAESSSQNNGSSSGSLYKTLPPEGTTTDTQDSWVHQAEVVEQVISGGGRSTMSPVNIGLTGTVEMSKTEFTQSAVQSPPVMTDDLRDSMIGQIVRDMRMLVEKHSSEIRLRLKPETLGDVSLRIRMDEGEMTAQINVTHQSVKVALEANLNQLRDALAVREIFVGRINISTGTESFARNPNSHPEHESKSRLRRRDQSNILSDYGSGWMRDYSTIELLM